ncbi:MAG TPA: glycosyltransferase [Acidimicrobiales bacterium]|nr:glycosyltransferase [Acidimicrobiales bacterium]
MEPPRRPPPGRLAVLLPCHNEAMTITDVVGEFRSALPHAEIYVYDNGSTDGTALLAAHAGAIVRSERRRGKGNVLRKMFADIEADVYVMADGDGTYDASAAPAMIADLWENHLDMVIGRRVEVPTGGAYRRGHRLGNQLLTRTVQRLFGDGPCDMLSGYRVLSRRYVKSFPAEATGFEAETEMTVHALDLRLSYDEVPTVYAERPAGSASKLRTLPDGLRILGFIVLLLKEYRPVRFFGVIAAVTGLLAALFKTGVIGSLTGVLSAQMSAALGDLFFGLALASVFAAVALDSLSRARREAKRMAYLHLGADALEREPASGGSG